jgi:hypothetical protein
MEAMRLLVKGLQKLGFMAFEQGGIFIMPQLLRHRAMIPLISCKELRNPHLVSFHDSYMSIDHFLFDDLL